jgi:hypothetical protein
MLPLAERLRKMGILDVQIPALGESAQI